MNKIVPISIIDTGNDKNKFCCICQENIDIENHFYPKTCQHSWCKTCHENYPSNKCPICRTKFRELPIRTPEVRDLQINIVSIRPTASLNNSVRRISNSQQRFSRSKTIIVCSIFCLIVNCIESISLHYSPFNYNFRTYLRNFCWERTSCVYQTFCVSFFFTCEHYKCKKIKPKIIPSVTLFNNESLNCYCSMFACLLFMFSFFCFGRLCYLIINPEVIDYWCDFDWFLLSAFIGLIVMAFYIVLVGICLIVITQFLRLCIKCTEFIFRSS